MTHGASLARPFAEHRPAFGRRVDNGLEYSPAALSASLADRCVSETSLRSDDGVGAPPIAEKLAPLIRAADYAGALHVVLFDYNLEDECILGSLEAPHVPLTDDERTIAEELLKLDEDQRHEVVAFANNSPIWQHVDEAEDLVVSVSGGSVQDDRLAEAVDKLIQVVRELAGPQ
jgi:hypothetical protein